MSLPAANVNQHAPAAAPSALAHGDISTINPHTGLSTDYLNHFTEAVMVLEMGKTMPDCLDDFRSWQPKTYREHFTASRFRDRDGVIAAYERADSSVRLQLEHATRMLTAILLEAQEALFSQQPPAHSDAAAHRAVLRAKPLIARAAAIINAADANGEAQVAVDAVFAK